MAGEAGAETQHSSPESAPSQRSRGKHRGLAHSLASTAGRESQHQQRTAPLPTSTLPPRLAWRKNTEAAPQALRDDEDTAYWAALACCGGARTHRRSRAATKPALELRSGRSRTKHRHQSDGIRPTES
jgi:hypothetical protein